MNDGYKELAAAIVERAVLDYRAALMHQDKYGRVSLEKFFCSGWFDILSDCDGKILMQMIRRRRKWHECKRVS